VAWSSSILSAGVRAAAAADAPAFLARHAPALSLGAYGSHWHEIGPGSSVASLAATQVDDSTYPASWAYDRAHHLRTRPTDGSTFGYALGFQLDGTEDLDALCIVGHNLADLSGTINVAAWVADNQAFSTNAQRIAMWQSSSFTSARLAALDLGPNHGSVTSGVGAGEHLRYSGAEWLQIVVRETSETAIAVPQIGEVWIGRRRQLSARWLVPWDEWSYESDVDVARSETGVRAAYVRSTGRFVQSSLRARSTGVDRYGLDDLAELRAWWTDTDYGARPFVYWREPTTLLADALVLATDDPTFRLPVVDYQTREAELPALTEVAPYRSGES
jgi:hypothetical protein